MSDSRRQIVLDYARWTVLSALRSGAPLKSRASVYPLLDAVEFGQMLDSRTPVTSDDFDGWHRTQTLELRDRSSTLPIGWAAKMINIYLKTAAYVGELGPPGIGDCIHPPVDGGLWQGFRRRFRDSNPELLKEVCCVERIKDIADYDQYRRIISGCRNAATLLGCRLIEVEQLWLGSVTPKRKTV